MHTSKYLRLYLNHRDKQFLLYFGLEERKMRASERAEGKGKGANSKVSASKIVP